MKTKLLSYFVLLILALDAPSATGSDPDGYARRRFEQIESLEKLVVKLGTADLKKSASFWNTGGPYVGVVHTPVTREIVSRGTSTIPYLIKRLDSSGYEESVYIVFCLRELHAVAATEAVAQLHDALRRNKKFPTNDATLLIQTERFLREAQSWKAR